MEIREPWWVPQNLNAFEKQLAEETPSGHVLDGIGVRALASRQDCDDVLFELLDGSSRVAVVHLTYSANVDRAWPRTKLFANYSAWLSEGMIPDSEDFDI